LTAAPGLVFHDRVLVVKVSAKILSKLIRIRDAFRRNVARASIFI
jgi:hypothetical protein